MPCKSVFYLLSLISILFLPSYIHAEEVLIDDFSTPTRPGGAPSGWKEIYFPRVSKHTEYTVIGGGNPYLKAYSAASASAIYKKVDIDLKNFPLLKWRWKVDNIVSGGEAGKKDADDFAARIYVAFSFDKERATVLERLKRLALDVVYGDEAPGEAITYIWASKLAPGESIKNPYAEESIMVAVKSGEAGVGQWFSEERNVYEDYRRLFGREPTNVKAVFIMADTDNTGERSSAYFDDVRFTERDN